MSCRISDSTGRTRVDLVMHAGSWCGLGGPITPRYRLVDRVLSSQGGQGPKEDPVAVSYCDVHGYTWIHNPGRTSRSCSFLQVQARAAIHTAVQAFRDCQHRTAVRLLWRTSACFAVSSCGVTTSNKDVDLHLGSIHCITVLAVCCYLPVDTCRLHSIFSALFSLGVGCNLYLFVPLP